MQIYYAGIDIGGTNIKVALTDEALHTICTRSIPTVPNSGDKSPETILDRVASLIKDMIFSLGFDPAGLRAIGLGMAGIVAPGTSELLQFNALGWSNFYPTKYLKKHFQTPVYLENDGTVNLIGETQIGAAIGCQDVILITLGTGVGGAIMTQGKILGGASGLGGEIGHIYINQGKTFQQYCSATSVVEFARNQMHNYSDSLLWEVSEGNPTAVTAKMIADCAKRKDLLCLTIMDQTSRHLAYALTSLINVFNPSLILIGGGMSLVGDLLLDPAIKQTLLSIHHPRLACPIIQTTLGDMAGALGSCALARLRTLSQKF